MKAFVRCVLNTIKTFLGGIGLGALALVIGCVIAGLIGGPVSVALFVACLKAVGIALGATAIVALAAAIRACA